MKIDSRAEKIMDEFIAVAQEVSPEKAHLTADERQEITEGIATSIIFFEKVFPIIAPIIIPLIVKAVKEELLKEELS